MRLMLKVQEYYTKSKIRRKNHPNKLNKDGEYKRENDQQTITKKKQRKNQSKQKVETLVNNLIQRKYKHFDEKHLIQTEILNSTCFNLKGEGKTKKRRSVTSKLSNPNNFFQEIFALH